MNATVYTVTSSQTSSHRNLHRTVVKHRDHPYLKDICLRDKRNFEQLLLHISDRPLILDSGCGTAMSTLQLAEQFPDHLVVGVDKSIKRLGKVVGQDHINPAMTSISANAILVQANLVDFWRLACDAQLVFDQHHLLYPNPWPKPKHLLRRFHAHPVFKSMVTLSKHFSTRSNWLIYLQEMQYALALYGFNARITPIEANNQPMTLFERKYFIAKEPVYRLDCKLISELHDECQADYESTPDNQDHSL